MGSWCSRFLVAISPKTIKRTMDRIHNTNPPEHTHDTVFADPVSLDEGDTSSERTTNGDVRGNRQAACKARYKKGASWENGEKGHSSRKQADTTCQETGKHGDHGCLCLSHQHLMSFCSGPLLIFLIDSLFSNRSTASALKTRAESVLT